VASANDVAPRDRISLLARLCTSLRRRNAADLLARKNAIRLDVAASYAEK
jgi:hypothetical protein